MVSMWAVVLWPEENGFLVMGEENCTELYYNFFYLKLFILVVVKYT